MNAIISISVILAFFVINAIVIKIFHREQDTLEEYAVGGRSFPWILSLFGFLGAWYVGAMYTGFFADSANIGIFSQYAAVYSVGTITVMYVLVRPVWIWGKLYNLETIADFIELRYNSKAFATFIAIFTFLFWSPWLIVEIKTIGYLVSAATYGVVPFNVGLVLVSLFVIIYCWLGGSRASAVGSLVQGIFFTFIGSITVLYLFNKAYGGFTTMFQMVAERAPELLIINDKIGYGVWSSAIIAGILGGMMSPAIFARMYMSKSVKEAKKSALGVPIIGAAFTIILLSLGLGGSLLNGFPEDAQSGIFWMAEQYGGPVVLGLIGIFAMAASMSTISAVVTAAAVMIGKNMLGLFDLNRRQILKYAKLLTLSVGIIAIFIATMEISRLVSIILYLYDCIAQVAVPIILGVFWKKGHKYGAAAGTIVGMSIVLLKGPFPWLVSWAGGLSAGLVGLLLNLIIYIVVSAALPKQNHVDQLFDDLNNGSDTKIKIKLKGGEIAQ
ncbi:hypothetical protein CVD25_09410 [Bacillus canaveralius]|uniref:Sodium:solute symporter family protein n=2 Tax=Bacillus TaxID=1386 RepID=A0A2N5GKS1_9BACI|nr:sodium:solute symporter family protein [Bacillus canaveralius]PLR82069.1 hypothetical protein CU635_12930 [Bacillus canaveralius]PLR98025.1 hypothetical protein CVD25_09410 [Bacillus canaveralius]